MGKNQKSVVVLLDSTQILVEVPLGVKYNHKKFEQETQRWQAGTRCHKWQTWVSKSVQNGQKKGPFGGSLGA